MFKLRDYQEEAVESINDYFSSGLGRAPVLIEPTGAGKSIIIAAYVAQMAARYPQIRIQIVAHVKELLVQNKSKLFAMLPLADIGTYSAGLNLRHTGAQFLFGGIQSIFRRAAEIGHTDMLIIDESHLINPRQAGRYRDYIIALREINPSMPVVGFTATPFRMGHGFIYEGEDAIFDGVAHETPITDLIDRGYLVPPIAKSSSIHADLTNVSKNSFGEFKESEMAEAFDDILVDACKDMIKRSAGRRCRLVFCSGCEHAQDVVRCLINLGEESVEYLDGKTSPANRADLLDRVVAGQVRWIVNIGVLTTGFDAPKTSAAVIARPTKSLVLYSQMVGRATRGLKAGGNKFAEIVTVVDTQLPGFKTLEESFNNWEDTGWHTK